MLEIRKLSIVNVVDAFFISLRVELESGVSAYIDTSHFVLCHIDLGNDQVFNVFYFLREVFQNRRQCVAVLAPGSVVHNEDVLG